MRRIKIIKHKIKIFIIGFTAALTTSGCCEDPAICQALALADLAIPLVADLLDQNGFPLIDPNTGNIIRAANEIYFNQRTGEYFNNDFPPTQGLLVGDIIEMGTNIFNTFSNTECEVGAPASASTTAPSLSINGPFFNGELPLSGMPTPPIGLGDRQFTATIFQLLTPGNYTVDFNANAPRNIEEHDFENNFYFGDNGNFGKSSQAFSFTVTESQSIKNRAPEALYNSEIAPASLEEMKELALYKFIHSPRFKTWYLNKLQASGN